MRLNGGMRRRTFLGLACGAASSAAFGGAAAGAAEWRVTQWALDVKDAGALAAGVDGAVYAAGQDEIVVLGPDGAEKRRFAAPGRPGCLAVDGDGRVFAGMRGHVAVFKADGGKAGEWGDFGERGWPTSIAMDDENVYVADAGNRVVWRFDHGGKLINRIGEDLNVPSPYFDVAINPIGELWVVNPGKHGLENYRPDGDMASSWYRPGIDAESFCGCCNPIHVAFMADCSLVTAEKGVDRVKIYGVDTKLVEVVAGETGDVENNSRLGCGVEASVTDLAVDSKNRILVLKKAERAIWVYEKQGT